MKIRNSVSAALLAVFAIGLMHRDGSLEAQQPPPPAGTQTPVPPPPGGGRQGGGRGVFPQQQRAPGDPALIERGRTIYSVTCSACHGADARGGQLGGVNLLRSQLVLADQEGEAIIPVVLKGRPEKGMPPAPITEADA